MAISWLLDHGFERIAYVDVDVHHGDGVQAAFYDDPRVLTISLHQHPLTLWPGTGWPREYGEGAAAGYAVNVRAAARHRGRRLAARLPRGRAVAARGVPAAAAGHPVRRRHPRAKTRWRTCGCRSTATATIYRELRDLAEQHGGGRWLALGGGGYGLFRVVPRSWTHLLATVLDRDVDPQHAGARRAGSRYASRLTGRPLPTEMTDGVDVAHEPWPTGTRPGRRRDLDTRRAVFPLHGLDPHDPRD